MRIQLFLASSSELKSDRDQMEIFIGRENKSLTKEGKFVELVMWEDFLDALSGDGLQKEYNKAIRQCDIFLMLYYTKVGKYTAEEFETAIGAYKEGGKPRIFTFFKDAELSTGKARREDLQSLWAFQDKLKELGHYQTVYTSIEDLQLKFGKQLRMLIEQMENEGGSMALQAPIQDTKSRPETEHFEEVHPKDPPPAKPKAFNLGNIHKLLSQAFMAQDLETFVMLNFPDVHQRFSPGMAQPARVNELLQRCQITGRLELLLDLVKAENPYQFDQFQPYQS